MYKKLLVTSFVLFLSVIEVFAAGTHGIHGESLSLFWTVPFIGILLSIALFPLFAPEFWHHHFGKVSAFWALLFIIPALYVFDFSAVTYEVLHVYLLEYIPFIILLLSLFTIAGGVRLTGTLVGSPQINTLLLLIGTALASWMGTTGAAMLLIRPLLKANAWRKKKKHTVIFFIFLVANVGGSLTPLGDPPLFLGFLKGVSFFWTTTNLLYEMLVVSGILLVIYYLWDTYLYNKEPGSPPPADETKLGLEGSFNLVLLLGVIAAVLFSGFVHMDHFDIHHVHIEYQNLIRDASLLLLAWISWLFTSKESRIANGFNWFPIKEVGKLFAGIFITIIPAIAILKAGSKGALSDVVTLVMDDQGNPNNVMFFWVTGTLSAFLDNAPTYLVFFNTAGGDALHLMNNIPLTLTAISCGAVFMGAMSYIGNAPNFMVKSIAESDGVRMPSFLAYLKWSFGIMGPVLILVTYLFFM